MLLADVARVSAEVAATSARSAKTALLAGLFRGADPREAPVALTYLSGRLPQGRVGIGWSVLRSSPPPAG
ncbi:ATP-dependent DNA ligase, partial [Streptomyces sp. AA8]|nr:ATP-dependent DNA ligase [Streptomyces telluris]